MAANFSMGKWQVFPDDCHVSDGKRKIKLEPKAMALLVVLANADGQLVSRDNIFAAVWKNQIIADHVLYNVIANLRKILEDVPQKPIYLITVPKKGYRLGRQAQQLQAPLIKSKNSKWQTLAKVCAIFSIFAIMAYWIYKPISEKSGPISETILQNSIAVLPFDIYAAEPNFNYFADGLSEEIIHQLAAIPQLAVVSRTSSFAFRDKNLDIKTIANKLNSQFILEGSVRKSEDQLRVTIQLIEAKTGTHLWSKVFDSTENNVFKLQQDISLSVVDSLLPNYGKIPFGKLRIHPQSGDAYMHYLRGSAMAAKATVEYIQMAIKEWEMAIKLRPDYALAHVSIALNTMVLYQNRVIESKKARDYAQAAINSALEVDPFMALAHTAQGLLHVNYDEFVDAEEAFITAINLDPASHLAHHNYGYLLTLQGKYDQALDHHLIALARNPMSAMTNFSVASSLYRAGQLNDAFKQFEHCISLLPDFPACHLGIANFYRFTNQAQKVQKHMLLAKQQLAQDNIYWIGAKTVDALMRGDTIKASSMANQVDTSEGSGYLGLQLKTLINIRMGKSENWLSELKTAAQQWPENKSITLALALNYYYTGNYTAAIALYESVLLENIELHGNFIVASWGVSHIANMADCYQQTYQQIAHQKIMQSLTLQMAKFKTGDYVIPGLMLLEAKIELLKGKPTQAKSKLKSLNALEWPLEWIKNVDPIFLHSK